MSVAADTVPNVSPLEPIPTAPPFAVRARVLTPLAAGGTRWEPDGLVVVDAAGRLTYAGPAAGHPAAPGAVDLRPLLALPGLVDLHVHLPQLPNAGRGVGLDVLTWLERYIFPLEQDWADDGEGTRVASLGFRALAAAGTTTALAYCAAYPGSTDAAFRAARDHGMRAILGMVLMDRDSYVAEGHPARTLEGALAASVALCERWHGADGGRLGYAFTPRFALSCTREMLRESAAAARGHNAYWQTHLSEDLGEVAEVARTYPEAHDYVDVYDLAGGLGPRSVMAHAIHLTDHGLARLAETGTRVAHCPSSNLFLSSGIMPLARYLDAGLTIGLGSDVAGGPRLSLFDAMRMGFTAQAVQLAVGDDDHQPLDPLAWLRLGTLDGARALGLDAVTGSLEAGKEADLILVDVGRTALLGGPGSTVTRDDDADPADLISRLIFREHPEMVRAAFVRGRRLPGPAAWERPAGWEEPQRWGRLAGRATPSIPGAPAGWSP